jgi:hypothetical protein
VQDEQEIFGTWHVKFRQWTWEYKFYENRSVSWRDIYNNENGIGNWTKTGKLINISWKGSTTKESWYCPITPDAQKGWYDADYGVGQLDAKRIEKVEPGALDFDCNIGRVPMFQQRGMTCWAAAAAMMISWRARKSMSIEQAISTTGEPYITYFRAMKKLPHAEMSNFAYAAGMVCEPMRNYTPKQLYELMANRRSPLYVDTATGGSISHVLVIKRIYGSGGQWNTSVEYNDPNTGEEDIANFDDFTAKLEGVADSLVCQIMHY